MAHHTIQPVPVKPWQEWAIAALVAALAVAASWIGVRNGFTYDDVFIVEHNELLRDVSKWWTIFQKPYWPVLWGADGYRPLTILAFMFEWLVGGGKPWLFHATNIALYAGCAASVYFLARACLPLAGAVLAAALFAVHPVHVEAVANVVGQAELLVAIFVIPAVTIYIRGRNAGDLSIWRQAAICLLFALALLSKEHGIVLPLLLLAAELIVVVDKSPIWQRFVKVRPFVLTLTAIAFAYLWAHMNVSTEVATGFHAYVPFTTTNVGPPGRIWTMLGLVPDWIRLFVWPARLSTEYGPPEYPVVLHFEPYQLPGILILSAAVALIVFGRRRSPTVSFGIGWAFIALLPTSNFIVASGILLAERTLFLPSVGVMLAMGALVPWVYRYFKPMPVRALAATAAVVIIGLGLWRSYTRTQVWKSNDTLFAAGILDAPNVYRTHYMLGAWHFRQKRKVLGEASYKRAMELYQKDPFVFFGLADEYLGAGINRSAAAYFRKSIEVDSTMVEGRARLALALVRIGEWDAAESEAKRALRENTRSGAAMRWVIEVARRGRAGEPTGLAPMPPLLPLPTDTVPPAGTGKLLGIVQNAPEKSTGARNRSQ